MGSESFGIGREEGMVAGRVVLRADTGARLRRFWVSRSRARGALCWCLAIGDVTDRASRRVTGI